MTPQNENFENISVNIYETVSFTERDQRDSDTNFFNDVNKSSFETSYFNPNEVKPVNEVQSIWKYWKYKT